MPRRFSRRSLSVLTLVAAALFLLAREYSRAPIPLSPAAAGDWRTIVRVIDGDTLLLDAGERVRLIGVDTPESVHPNKPVETFAKEATAFTRRLTDGRRARLEYDTDRTDRYGRTLAYVFLDDGTHLNAEIIRQGFGHAYTRFPFARMEEFRALEREARQHRRGLWAAE